jgi:hypothetical protein
LAVKNYSYILNNFRQNPEVIFLQEMIPQLMPDLKNLMGQMYHVISQEPNCGTYFCVTLVSKASRVGYGILDGLKKFINLQDIKITHKETIPFENSLMGRGMLIVEVRNSIKIAGKKFKKCPISISQTGGMARIEAETIEYPFGIDQGLFHSTLQPICTMHRTGDLYECQQSKRNVGNFW